MNRSYRSVWNESLGAWVATSEVTAARGKKSSSNRALVSSSVLASVLAAAALMPSLALADTVNDTYGVCLRSTGQGTWTCEVPVAGGGVARISGVPDAYNGPDAAFVNNWAAQNLGANALAIGNLLTQAIGESSIAIGNAAKAQAEASTAIGTSAQAIAINSVALGAGSKADGSTLSQAAYAPGGVAVAGTTPVAEVSLGSAGKERRITNLAAGATDTDAVNVSQLKASQAAATTHYYSVKSTNQTAGSNFDNTGATGANATAAGVEAAAGGVNATALGYSSNAAGVNSVSVGDSSASGSKAVGIGFQANASGNNSVAIGDRTAAADDGVAIGGQRSAAVTSAASGAVALGSGARAVGLSSVAIGTYTAAAENAVAIGNGANGAIANSVAIGRYAYGGVDAVQVGYSTVNGNASNLSGAYRRGTTLIGGASNSQGLFGTVIGSNNNLLINEGVTSGGIVLGSNVFGKFASQGAMSSIQGAYNKIGDTANSNPYNSIAVSVTGAANQVQNSNGVMINGYGNTINNSFKNAINLAGLYASSSLGDTTDRLSALVKDKNTELGQVGVIGAGNTANAASNTFIVGMKNSTDNTVMSSMQGFNLTANELQNSFVAGADSSILKSTRVFMVGTNNKVANATDMLVMGNNQVVGSAGTTAVNSILLGNNIQFGDTVSAQDAVAIGGAAKVVSGAVAVGVSAQALGANSIAIGRNAIATGSIAQGANSRAGNGGAAFGDGAVATYLNGATTAGTVAGAALGNKAVADISGATALGTGAQATAANSVALGSSSVASGATLAQAAYAPGGATVAGVNPAGEVSVGSMGAERRITNLAAGATDTDAVNVSQLKAVSAAAVASATHYYSVNDGGSQAGNYANDGATGAGSLAAGVNVRAEGKNSTAVGSQSTVTNSHQSSAFGYANNIISKINGFGDNTLVAGSENSASEINRSVVLGHKNSAVSGSVVSVMGVDNTLNSVNKSQVIGNLNSVKDSLFITAFGAENNISFTRQNNVIGNWNNISGTVAEGSRFNTVIGDRNNMVDGVANILVGDGHKVGAGVSNSYVIGSISTVTAGVTQAVAIGRSASVGANNGIALGAGANAAFTNSISMGLLSGVTGNNGAALGVQAKAGTNATAVGVRANAVGNASVALGTNALATVDAGVALGRDSVASTVPGIAGYVPSGASGSAIAATQSTLGALSVGNAANGVFRQINGVAAGTVDSDAVNVAQLKAVDTKASAGWNIGANAEATGLNVAPGGKVDFSASNANLTVQRSGTDIQYGLSNTLDLSSVGSITTGNAVLNNAGVTVTNGSNSSVFAAGSASVTNGSQTTLINPGSVVIGQGAAPVAIDGVKGEVTGLTNKTLSVPGYATSGRAATEEQLNLVSLTANSAAKGWNIASSGNATATNVAPDSTVTFNGDSNITVKHSTDANGAKLDVTLNPDLNVTSVTAGNTKVDAAGVSFTGSQVALTATGLNNGGNKLSNVAAGTAATDAVNLSQLQSATAGVATHYYSVNDGGAQAGNYVNDGAAGTNSVAAGVNASAKKDGAVAIGSASADEENSVAIGINAKAADKNSVALGSGSETRAAVAIASDTALIPATTLNFAGASNVVGVLSVGGANGATRQIVNVAPGALSATSTDAVNGSQLFAVAKGLNDRIDNIQLTPGPQGPKGDPGPAGPEGKPGDGGGTGTGTGTAQENPWITGNVATRAAPRATGLDTLAAGSNAVASGEFAKAIGNESEASGYSAIAFGYKAKAGGRRSIALGDRSVTTGDSSVSLGSDSSDGGRSNVISVGSEGAERQVTNVAPGTQGTDAVNLNQLNQMGTQINNQFGNLQHQIDANRREANAGTAGAMAMAGMPQAYMPGKSMLAAGAASFRGESALAVGMSSITDNGRWVTKFTGSANSRGQVGVSVGAGYQW